MAYWNMGYSLNFQNHPTEAIEYLHIGYHLSKGTVNKYSLFLANCYESISLPKAREWALQYLEGDEKEY